VDQEGYVKKQEEGYRKDLLNRSGKISRLAEPLVVFHTHAEPVSYVINASTVKRSHNISRPEPSYAILRATSLLGVPHFLVGCAHEHGPSQYQQLCASIQISLAETVERRLCQLT
jgi:hypothetical protein